jgi:hypothetical protein
MTEAPSQGGAVVYLEPPAPSDHWSRTGPFARLDGSKARKPNGLPSVVRPTLPRVPRTRFTDPRRGTVGQACRAGQEAQS